MFALFFRLCGFVHFLRRGRGVVRGRPAASERHYQRHALAVSRPEQFYLFALVQKCLSLCVAYGKVVLVAQFVLALGEVLHLFCVVRRLYALGVFAVHMRQVRERRFHFADCREDFRFIPFDSFAVFRQVGLFLRVDFSRLKNRNVHLRADPPRERACPEQVFDFIRAEADVARYRNGREECRGIRADFCVGGEHFAFGGGYVGAAFEQFRRYDRRDFSEAIPTADCI